MRRRSLLILFCALAMFFDNIVVAQQDPQYSHYMFNQMAVNPGYAGSRNAICATAIHRQQWVGMNGAPVTSVFSVNTPFRLFGQTHGAGLTILSDQLGFDKDISIGLDYAFQLDVGQGKLGIGISGLYINRALKATWHAPDGTDGGGDNAIPGADESISGFDMGLGLFYRSERAYLGVSSTHLLQPKMDYEKETAGYTLKRHYYVSGGYLFPLKNPAWELDPSVMAYSDGVSSQVTMNMNVVYNKKFWGGLGYRWNDALIFMIGLDIFNGIKIGYSYEYSHTSVRRYSGGSHEIMVNYCFNIFKEKIVKKYKSVRYL